MQAERPEYRQYPLTAIQRTVLRRMDTGAMKTDHEYIRSVFACDEPVDVAALQRAFADLYQRHDALRTTVTRAGEGDAASLQCVHATNAPEIHLLDLGAADDPQVPNGAALETAQQLAFLPFSLDRGPLCRFFHIRLPGGKCLFGFVTHHLISDHVAHAILREDLTRLYRRHLGEDVALADPPLAYADFVEERLAWDRDWHRSPDAYHWQGEVRPNEPLPGVTGRAGAAGQARIASPPVQFSTGREELARLARAFRATPFVLVLAAFCAAYLRDTGRKAILLAVVSDERGTRYREVVGCFATAYHIYIEVPRPDMTFDELVGIVRKKYFGMFERPWVPGSYLWQVEETLAGSGESGIYIFDYVETPPQAAAGLLGLETREVRLAPPLSAPAARSAGLEPVVFFLWNSEAGISGVVSGETDPAFPYTERLLKGIEAVLAGLCQAA